MRWKQFHTDHKIPHRLDPAVQDTRRSRSKINLLSILLIARRRRRRRRKSFQVLLFVGSYKSVLNGLRKITDYHLLPSKGLELTWVGTDPLNSGGYLACFVYSLLKVPVDMFYSKNYILSSSVWKQGWWIKNAILCSYRFVLERNIFKKLETRLFERNALI